MISKSEAKWKECATDILERLNTNMVYKFKYVYVINGYQIQTPRKYFSKSGIETFTRVAFKSKTSDLEFLVTIAIPSIRPIIEMGISLFTNHQPDGGDTARYFYNILEMNEDDIFDDITEHIKEKSNEYRNKKLM